jgi:ATP-binding cassette subfamily C protein
MCLRYPTTGSDLLSESASPKTVKSSVRKLYELFSPRDRMKMLMLFIAGLFTALAQAGGVVAIFPFINVVMNPHVVAENRWMNALFRMGSFQDEHSFMLFLGCLVFAMIVVSSLAPAFLIWGQTRFFLYKEHTLSIRLLATYLSRPYQYFLGKNTSELIKNVLNEVGSLTMGMMLAIFEVLIQGFLLFVLVATLLIVDVGVTVTAMLLLGGSYALLSFLIKKKLKKGGEERMNANRSRFRVVNEAFSGIKINRVMGIESYFVENYNHYSLQCIKPQIFADLSSIIPRYFLEALAFGGIALFLVFKLMRGDSMADMLPLVSLYAFAAYRMMPALCRVYQSTTRIIYYQAILDKIYTDMTDPAPLEETLVSGGSASSETGTDAHVSFAERIRLIDVDFCYENASVNVIKKMSIEIPKDTTIGFVGATGSGKTTLVDILLGLLPVGRGQMLVDGVPITEKNVRSWRRKIGYVPQDIFLSDDTIRRNIAFGLAEEEIDDEKVVAAARIAALEGFIATLPAKYETLIGERGVRISGGQRQRIGLARALYRNPELLVLDEATSSLDGTTEDAVLQAIRNASKSRTVIMIAHRLNTLKDCDTIYMMSKGRFTACGTYEELLRGNKTFMKMAKVT